MLIFGPDLTNEIIVSFTKSDTGITTFAGLQVFEGSGGSGPGPQMLSYLDINDLIEMLSKND
jgi:hypothetical protein